VSPMKKMREAGGIFIFERSSISPSLDPDTMFASPRSRLLVHTDLDAGKLEIIASSRRPSKWVMRYDEESTFFLVHYVHSLSLVG
jgi:hypothetical protein